MKLKSFLLVAIMVVGLMSSCTNKQKASILPSVNDGIAKEFKMEFTEPKKLVLGDLFYDGAMFQRNKPITVYGCGFAGSTVTATLLQGENTVAERTGIICEDGSV